MNRVYKIYCVWDEEGNLLHTKTFQISKYDNPKEYKEALKKEKKILKRKNYHKKLIFILRSKISEPHLYPTKNLWNEFMRFSWGIYNEGFWSEFERELLSIAKNLAIRD